MGEITNFPDGVSSFGAPVIAGGLPLAQKYFWVSSVAGSDGNEGNGPQSGSPFATIDWAVGKCVAGRGDVIIVMPGHVETVTAAAGLALDVAGITIYGYGNGELMPQINFTTVVGASMRVTADDITVSGIRFTGGIDALTNPIDVRADDFTLLNSRYTDVTGQATNVILTTSVADRMTIRNWSHYGDAAAGTASGIAVVGGDGHIIDGVYADGNFSVGFFDVRGTATTNLQARNWIARTRNAADVIGVDTITGSTGTIGPNMYFAVADNAANFAATFSGATFRYHNPVSVVNLAGEMGGIDTTASAGFKTLSTNA